MNAIVNKLLLAVDKSIHEMHLEKPGCKYSVNICKYSTCRPFSKNKEIIKKLKKQEIQDIFIIMN